MLPLATTLLFWLEPALPAFLAGAPSGQGVELAGERAIALFEAARDPVAAAAVHAATRRVRIQRRDGRVFVTVRWQLDAVRPGWLAGMLVSGGVLVRSVTIDGRPAATAAHSTATYVAAWIAGPAELELVAEMKDDPVRGPVAISLLGATRGTAVIDGEPTWRLQAAAATPADGTSAVTVHISGVTHGAPTDLELVARPAPSEETGVVALGRVGVGLFVGEAEMRGRARLQWVLRRGDLERVTFVARGVGEDFTVVGPDVREVKRDGEVVRVELQTAVSDVVALEATWSQRTPSGDATVTPASFELEGTNRTEATFELGRDGDVDVVPTLQGWRQVAAQQLPPWGRDLIEGAAAAAWTRAAGAEAGRLQLLRFVPVEAPKVVIGQATFNLASADHGMTLVKARYEVTNERASHLRFTLPARSRLLAVEVGGADVRAARDGDEILVPISRSLETIEGLVAIPVVVSLITEQRRWRRREHRELALPSVDAPIRNISARWLLPRDVKATTDIGDDGVGSIVRAQPPEAARTRGPSGGQAGEKSSPAKHDRGGLPVVGSKSTESTIEPAENDDMRQAASDQLLREAQEYYNVNAFDDAQQRLDQLRDQGLAADDAKKLQSNLDVVNAPVPSPDAPPAEEPADASRASSILAGKAGVFRRVKDQARARGQKQRIQLDARKRKAKELWKKGDYKAAEVEYREVIEKNRRLENLEQDESATVDFENEALEGELESTKTEAAARASMDAQTSSKWMWSADDDAEYGLGAAWVTASATLDVPDPATTTGAPPPNHGPRVLMPTRGGDLVLYAFDLWAPGSRHTLVVAAKRRRHRD